MCVEVKAMICPYCGGNTRDGGKFCECCGKELGGAVPLKTAQQNAQQTAKLLSNTGMVLGQEARRLRLEADYSDQEIISDRVYNLIMVGTVIWGLLVNALICAVVGDVTRMLNPLILIILYIALSFAGIRIAAKSTNPWISFLGYNMMVVPFGFVLSVSVQYYLSVDPGIVTSAFVYTLLITAGMLGAVMAFPKFFAKLGGALLGCLIGVVVCELLLVIFGVDQSVTDWICAGMFSLYIGFDIYRSQQFAKTVDNAVDCALDIYLDIANLFVRLMSVLGKKDD